MTSNYILVTEYVCTVEEHQTLERERDELRAEKERLRAQNDELHRQINYTRALAWGDISDSEIVGNLRRMLDRPKE